MLFKHISFFNIYHMHIIIFLLIPTFVVFKIRKMCFQYPAPEYSAELFPTFLPQTEKAISIPEYSFLNQHFILIYISLQPSQTNQLHCSLYILFPSFHLLKNNLLFPAEKCFLCIRIPSMNFSSQANI